MFRILYWVEALSEKHFKYCVTPGSQTPDILSSRDVLNPAAKR